jgi:hypothetical protein
VLLAPWLIRTRNHLLPFVFHSCSQVTVPSAPSFSSPSTVSLEATTDNPYLGAPAGNYTPAASDAIDHDLSASVKTFLANGTQIELSGASAYLFPLGPTKIRHTVTNSFGLTAELNVTIRVVDTTVPVVTVTGASSIVVNSTTAAYAGKVSGPAVVFAPQRPAVAANSLGCAHR